ncbi:MAG: Gfo/Idh/MocA family oxidoreductase [Treponema sp.]|jgi:predicted dehydrogenase|nr:Gfo/Idh/MocA family oxidoreductase [Treponema sp.]
MISKDNDAGAVKTVLIGCGGFTFNTLYPMLRNQPVRLAAVCDTDPARREAFARFYAVEKQYEDYREMILTERPGAVLCVVNADMHYEAAKLCLQEGIPVFVEKTPCRTSGQAEELAELQKRSGTIAAVGFNRRYCTAYTMAREIIRRPEFGRISMYYSKFNADPYGSHEYFIFNHIIHHIDLARYLLGEITDIQARRTIIDEKSGAWEVHFTALESGAVGTIQAASMLNEAYPMERLDIASTGGNVVVDNLRDLRYNRTGPRRDRCFAEPLANDGDCLTWNLSNGYGIGAGIFSYLGFEVELDEFFSALRGGPKPRSTIEECVGTMKAMEAVRRFLN